MRPGDEQGGKGRSPLALAGLGLELAVIVILIAAGGRWLDRLWGTEPWLLVLGAGLGMVLAMYNLIRRVRREEEKEPDADR